MKRVLLIPLAALLCLTASGCGGRAPADTTAAPAAEETGPVWARGRETDGQLLQGLNLDGVGGADDEAYVSVRQYGDYEERITVLCVHLGTGETLANTFPAAGRFRFLTGNLFSEDREAIVLEIPVPGSNYGAADLFVLDICPAGEEPVPASTVRMDTLRGIRLCPGADLPERYRTDPEENTGITISTELVDIAGSPLQGLKLHAIGDDREDLMQVFHWVGGNTRGDDGWALLDDPA